MIETTMLVADRLVSLQNQLSLLAPDALAEDVPAAVSHGLSFIARSPLGAGFLAHSRRDTSRSWMPTRTIWHAPMRHETGIAAVLEFAWSAAPSTIAIGVPRDVGQLDPLLRAAQRRASTAI
jgi:aryl-alcohol dehydrogenase-like predicted oxidoreductase